MPDLTASRTLVKSHPELWTECSDADSLGRHLDGFGDIRITRLEPETAVAWEGEHARGTVTLEPSGWGTRVVLTARASPPAPEHDAVAPQSEVPPERELELEASSEPPRPGFFTRLLARWRRPPDIAAEHEELEPVGSDGAAAVSADLPEPGPDPYEVLLAALDSLGQAHHRPFSRA